MTLAQSCKNTLACLCRHLNISIASRRKINHVSIMIILFFGLNCVKGKKSLNYARLGSKFACVGLVMSTLTRLQIPSLVNIMLNH